MLDISFDKLAALISSNLTYDLTLLATIVELSGLDRITSVLTKTDQNLTEPSGAIWNDTESPGVLQNIPDLFA